MSSVGPVRLAPATTGRRVHTMPDSRGAGARALRLSNGMQSVTSAIAGRLAGNWDFIVPLLFLAFIRIPYVAPNTTFVPSHDTFLHVEIFHYFYQEYCLHDEIPLWEPYHVYGTPTDFDFFGALTLCQYFFAALGRAFGIIDALHLYICSLLLEELIFLIGVYLLARHLFQYKFIVAIVCLAAIGTNFWACQIHFNFRIFSLLPYLLLMLFRFVDNRSPTFLTGAGYFMILMMIGNTTYFVPIYVLITAIILITALSAADGTRQLSVRRFFQPFPLILLSLLVCLVFLYYDMLDNMFGYVEPLARERLSDGSVTLQDYLTYECYFDPLSFLGFLYPYDYHFDSWIYLGPVFCIFAIYGLIRCWSDCRCRACACVSLLFILLSFPKSTFVPALLYYVLPTMEYYRHLEHARPIAKLLFFFVAGYGMEYSLQKRDAHSIFWISFGLIGVVLAADIFVLDETVPYMSLQGLVNDPGFHYLGMIGAVVFCCILWPYVCREGPRGIGLSVALLVFLMASYQWVLFVSYPIHVSETGSTVDFFDETIVRDPKRLKELKAPFTVSEYEYQEQRLNMDTVNEILARKAPLVQKVWGARYQRAYSCAGIDPCLPNMRVDYVTEGVYNLISARVKDSENESTSGDMWADAAEDEVFLTATGCNSPKMRVVGSVRFATSESAAVRLVGGSSDIHIRPVALTTSEEWKEQDGNGYPGQCRVEEFVANQLTANVYVAKPSGAWLYYADAYHPGWHAWIDGTKAEVVSGNLAFKLIHVPPGYHSVEMRFVGCGRNAVYLNCLLWFGVVFVPSFLLFTLFLCFRRTGN